MSRIFTLLTFALFSASVVQAQDKLYKKTGEVLETKVLEVGTSEVKYKLFNNQTGPTYALPRVDLVKIMYENGTTESFATNADGLSAADVKRAQNIQVEWLGQGLLFTLNYDTRFGKRRNGLGGRIGFGGLGGDGVALITVPVSLNYLLGNGKNLFEIGLGATYANFNDEPIFGNNNLVGTMAFMYRLQPVKSGFSFRGGLTPIFTSTIIGPYAGFSLGYTF